jgi:hypothetical protein
MTTALTETKGLGRALALAGQVNSTVKTVYSIAGTVSSMAAFYHGYKRNNGSFLWGLWWFVMGGFLWPITMAFALSQGFAKPRKV